MINVPEAPKLSGTAEDKLRQLEKYAVSLSEWLSVYLDKNQEELKNGNLHH